MSDTTLSAAPLNLFYSYSRKDEEYREKLKTHLEILKHAGIIEGWYDGDIDAGNEWEEEIEQKLAQADIILLLISADFIASKFCYENEMTKALKRHDAKEAVVIPIILRACDWKIAPFQKLKSLPNDGKAVQSWGDIDEAFTDITEGIKKVAVKRKSVKLTNDKTFDVPFSENLLFKGRETELQTLRERLTSGGKAAVTQAIRGLGGIGKTQLAVQYAYQYQDEYEHVFWVQLSNELSEDEEGALPEDTEPTLPVTNSYVENCQKLRVPFDETQPQTAVLAFKRWMEQNFNWLLIFDNADDPKILKPFLPQQSQGHILLTSRAHSFASLGILKPIEVETLPLDKATEFLIDRVARELEESEQEFAAELAKEIDGLPLALEQAGAYIHEKSINFERYLNNYRQSKLELLEKQKPVMGDYPESVQTTWSMNFEAIKEQSEAAADLFRFCAYLAPDAIPYELIAEGASFLGDSIQELVNQSEDPMLAVVELLQPLANYSLIKITPGEEEFSIHRLVQEVMKAEVPSQDEESIWVECVVNAVNQIYPWPEYSNWQECRRLSSQILVASDYVKHSKIETENSGDLLSKQGRYFYDVGEYKEAEPLYLEAMGIRRTVVGENHPSFATSLNNLAGLYKSQERSAEAEPLYLQAMEICRAVLGENHPAFATSLNNLASLYESQGRFEEAEPLHLQALEIRRTALGENHPSFATSLNNLAFLYKSQERYEEAEPLYLQAMEILDSTLGSEHPSTKIVCKNYQRMKEMRTKENQDDK